MHGCPDPHASLRSATRALGEWNNIILRRVARVTVALLVFLAISRGALAQGTYIGPVERPPKIIQQPASLTIEQGQAAVFKVTADPNNALYTYLTVTYQWMKNGSRITGATSQTLTLPNAQPADAGSYLVVVSNKLGWVASSTITLNVIVTVPATILTQPNGLNVNEGQSATFTVVAAGTPAPTYRWRKNGNPIAGATSPQLTLANVKSDDAGSYDVLVSNSRNSIFSRAVMLRVLSTNTAEPAQGIAITTQPTGAALNPGEAATLTITASGENLAYQWRKNGTPLHGATTSTFTLSSVTTADMGFYSVIVSGAEDSIESDVAILAVTSSTGSRLINLSTRGYVPAGGSLTPGFTLRGMGTAELLVRAVGPTLARFGVTGACVDPGLELIPAGAAAAMLANDDWTLRDDTSRLAIATAAVGAFALDVASKDAALLASLDSALHQSYTARIVSKDTTAAGVVLAEIYDAGPSSSPVQLAAVSTLGFAGAGERALVSGFTIEGVAPKRLLIRAVGPSLQTFGVSDVLADPQLAIVGAGQKRPIASSDNWSANNSVASAATMAGAFRLAPGSNDAALVILLPPGAYTVTVSGAGGTTGTALVEIYDLDR